MEFNVFITKTVTFWFRNNPPRPAMNRFFFFFTFTCDETADWRDTISCFYSADLNLIIDFYKLQGCLVKSNIFPILDLSFKKLIFNRKKMSSL